MTRIENLKSRVDELYGEHREGRDAWADWLYGHHVMLVADKAGELARRFGANEELCRAAGMLHDIANAEMSRFDTQHEARSLEIARAYLAETGFTPHDSATVVDDAIMFHGCRNGQVPQTLEGRVMAAADAVVHFTTDFYEHADAAHKSEGMTDAESKAWSLKKIERDFNEKILFPEVREEVRETYEALKQRFSAL